MIKVAFPTNDGETISPHLGQARYFQVISIDEGSASLAELREKPSHSHHDHQHEGGAGAHPGQAMVDLISDCQVLIAGGMGEPMFARASAKGMQVILTGETSIKKALDAYQHGNLSSDPRRVHKHG